MTEVVFLGIIPFAKEGDIGQNPSGLDKYEHRIPEGISVSAQVAQLDRASGYGPEGREFESCLAHSEKNLLMYAGSFLS